MKTLLLIPTDFERQPIEGGLVLDQSTVRFETGGFGVIDSAIGTATLLSQWNPDRVILAGIAGGYFTSGDDPRLGTACCFDSVTLDGIGVGVGKDFLTAQQLGWKWNDDSSTCESLPLRVFGESGGQLLTTCAASASLEEAQWRKHRFSEALAEDMEGFAVAAACNRAKVPLTIVRGFSNRAGDRNQKTWKTEQALKSVTEILARLLES